MYSSRAFYPSYYNRIIEEPLDKIPISESGYTKDYELSKHEKKNAEELFNSYNTALPSK
jgi:hypothetical protein